MLCSHRCDKQGVASRVGAIDGTNAGNDGDYCEASTYFSGLRYAKHLQLFFLFDVLFYMNAISSYNVYAKSVCLL